MISEPMVIAACRREHRALIQCAANGDCREDWDAATFEDYAHHAVVLYVLRAYLAQEYHRIYHEC